MKIRIFFGKVYNLISLIIRYSFDHLFNSNLDRMDQNGEVDYGGGVIMNNYSLLRMESWYTGLAEKNPEKWVLDAILEHSDSDVITSIAGEIIGVRHYRYGEEWASVFDRSKPFLACKYPVFGVLDNEPDSSQEIKIPFDMGKKSTLPIEKGSYLLVLDWNEKIEKMYSSPEIIGIEEISAAPELDYLNTNLPVDQFTEIKKTNYDLFT